MTALRCTQKLLAVMKVARSKQAMPELNSGGANRLGDWSLNLLHTRPKLVVAVCEHGRLGLVLAAAPYATLPLCHFATTFCSGSAQSIVSYWCVASVKQHPILSTNQRPIVSTFLSC